MIHLFKKVYITIDKLHSILPGEFNHVIKLTDVNWQEVYASDYKILILGNANDTELVLNQFLNRLGFVAEEKENILKTYEDKFKTLMGVNAQPVFQSFSVTDFSQEIKFSNVTTDLLPVIPDVSELGLEYQLIFYLTDGSNDVLLSRIDKMLRVLVCYVMLDFKKLFLLHLPEVCNNFNIDILDKNIEEKLIAHNKNFQHILDDSWNEDRIHTMLSLNKDQILDYYNLIKNHFIKYRVEEWPMPIGIILYYNNPKKLVDALIQQTDPKVRGWPGGKWFYQMNKHLWFYFVSKKDAGPYLETLKKQIFLALQHKDK